MVDNCSAIVICTFIIYHILHDYTTRENPIHAWNMEVAIAVDDYFSDEGVGNEAWSHKA